MQYRRKLANVQAICWDGTENTLNQIAQWCVVRRARNCDRVIVIQTGLGLNYVLPEHWVVRFDCGACIRYDPMTFASMYEVAKL